VNNSQKKGMAQGLTLVKAVKTVVTRPGLFTPKWAEQLVQQKAFNAVMVASVLCSTVALINTSPRRPDPISVLYIEVAGRNPCHF
jgi:hypothetical protein